MKVKAYTDGACSGNLGPGGWAFSMTCGNHTLTNAGSIEHTTNNAAELTAVLAALRAIKRPCELEVTPDSTLVIDLLGQGWKRKNTSLKELCEQIEAEAQGKGVVLSFVWTKGHANNTTHNRIDMLARFQARRGWQKNAFRRGTQAQRSLPTHGG
jgi:ribonuclease HI